MTKIWVFVFCVLICAGPWVSVNAQNPNLAVGGATYRLSLALQPATATVVCSGVTTPITLVATVTKNADGTPVQGATVTFPNTGTAWNPFAPLGRVTGADGTAVANINLVTSHPGYGNFTASLQNGASATIQIVAIGGPYTIVGGNMTFPAGSSNLLLRGPASPDGPSPTVTCISPPGQLVGTTFSWSITTGAGKVRIVGASTNASVMIQAAGPSAAYNDVTLQLQYSYRGHACDYAHTFTVHVASRPPSEAVLDRQDKSSHVPPNWHWSRGVSYTIKSQLYLPLQGIYWDEFFTFDDLSADKNPITGGRHSASDGSVHDNYGGDHPDNAVAAVRAAGDFILDAYQSVTLDKVPFWANHIIFTYTPTVWVGPVVR